MKAVDALAALVDQQKRLGDAAEQARLAKWRAAAGRAQATGKMANTLAKALAKRFSYRWQFIDFVGPKGRESAGIVDIVAIRKCGKAPFISGLKKLDTFDIQLIQVKGGSAPMPIPEEISRLRSVQKHYRADRVVLFQWIKGEKAMFSVLGSGNNWTEATAGELFGSRS